jgi:branched-chain amino acid transport system ATP-binding protein
MLRAEGLDTYYGSSHVLRAADLAVGEGEAVALLGRNGMGKTTLLRSLCGLTPPHRGTVRVLEHDVTRWPAFRIARLGVALVPEGRGVFPNLSVRENLLMAARPGRWNVSRVLEFFPRLAERLSHGGAALSGGEQQMLAIARALLTNPRLLLLDEATEGLAPLVARDIWNALKQLRDAGLSLVVVDKDFAALASFVDRVNILVKGEMVFNGGADELRSDPSILRRHLGV